MARHLQLDVEVAIKLMAPEHAASSEGRARFQREAKISAQLRAPNVAHVYDYGVEDGVPYLVMELLHGEDFEARLVREGRLTPAATASIVAQVCKALSGAHAIGLVHRDIKPANLFLARQGEEEIVKILDFGIAKSTGLLVGQGTKTGTLLGSPYYMSPEQVRRSKDVDLRSDLWSLGVIIYRCLTGRLPFQGEELGDLFVAICTDEIPLASQLAPELDPGMDGFLARALARDPEHRFQSARELADTLAGVVHGMERPLGAPPVIAATAPAAGSDAATAPAQSGTLAPAGSTVAPPPNRRRLNRVVATVSGGVVALGLAAAATLVLRGQSQGAGAGSQRADAAGPSALPAATDPAPAPPPPAVPPAPAVSAGPEPSTSATASASAPRRHSPPPPAPPPGRGAPTPDKPGNEDHDPLDHR